MVRALALVVGYWLTAACSGEYSEVKAPQSTIRAQFASVEAGVFFRGLCDIARYRSMRCRLYENPRSGGFVFYVLSAKSKSIEVRTSSPIDTGVFKIHFYERWAGTVDDTRFCGADSETQAWAGAIAARFESADITVTCQVEADETE